MAVTYTDFQGETINPALDSLLQTEFGAVLDTRFQDRFEDNYLARRGEYIRWFADEGEFIEGISNGETRQYNYQFTYYIDDAHKYVKKFYEGMITDRIERLTALINQNRGYNPGGSAYKWHSAIIENVTKPTRLNEEIEEVKDSIWFVNIDVTLTRTNCW